MEKIDRQTVAAAETEKAYRGSGLPAHWKPRPGRGVQRPAQAHAQAVPAEVRQEREPVDTGKRRGCQPQGEEIGRADGDLIAPIACRQQAEPR